MKLIQLPVALIALSLITVPFAFAQETETPTEKASPTPTEKSETKTSDTEKKSETEKAETEKSPAPAEKSAQKKEIAEASPSAKTAATASAAAKPMAKGSVDAQLKDIEAKWAQAFQTRDATVVEGILAANYVMTDEKGKVLNRGGALKAFKKNTDTLEKTSISHVVVHPISNDAAVVTGMTHDVGKDKSGKKFDRTYRWTDTFVNRSGKWECVATHLTLVAQK